MKTPAFQKSKQRTDLDMTKYKTTVVSELSISYCPELGIALTSSPPWEPLVNKTISIYFSRANEVCILESVLPNTCILFSRQASN